MTSHESLAALVESDDLWLRSCALYVVGIRRQRVLVVAGAKRISNPPMRGSVRRQPGPGSPWLRS